MDDQLKFDVFCREFCIGPRKQTITSAKLRRIEHFLKTGDVLDAEEGPCVASGVVNTREFRRWVMSTGFFLTNDPAVGVTDRVTIRRDGRVS